MPLIFWAANQWLDRLANRVASSSMMKLLVQNHSLSSSIRFQAAMA